MFKYTKASLDIITKDLKKYQKIFIFLTLGVSLTYYIYAAIKGLGNLYIDILLSSILLLNIIFEILIWILKLNYSKKSIRLAFKISRFIARTFNLGLTIYGLYLTTTNVNSITIILVSLLAVSWLFEFILELLINAIMPKLSLIVVALDKDIGFIKKPVNVINNTYKKIKGEKIENDYDYALKENKVLDDYFKNEKVEIKEDKKEEEVKKVKPNKRFRFKK